MDGKMKMESEYQSWQIFHQLQKQLYSLSDASAPSRVAVTIIVGLVCTDLCLCSEDCHNEYAESDDEYDEDEVEQEIP